MTTVPSAHGPLISFGSSNATPSAGDRLYFSGASSLSADPDSTVAVQLWEPVDQIDQLTGKTFGVSLAGTASRPRKDYSLTFQYYLAVDPTTADASVWAAMQDIIDKEWDWFFSTYAYSNADASVTYPTAAGMAGDLVVEDATGAAQVCAADWDEWAAEFIPGEPSQYVQQFVFTQLTVPVPIPPPAAPMINTLVGTGTLGTAPIATSGDALSTDIFPTGGLVYDTAGNLFWANHNVVYTFPHGSSTIALYAGTTADTSGYSGDGGLATSALLGAPIGLAIGLDGNLYITDTDNGLIRAVDHLTGLISTYVSGFSYPSSCCFDSAGNLYVVDTNAQTVFKVGPGGAPTTTYAGTGSTGYSGDGGVATSATLNLPNGCWCDSADNVFISDQNNPSVIRRIDHATHIITTVAGGGSSTSEGVAATLAILGYVQTLFISVANVFYIPETVSTAGERVRKVPLAMGLINTLAGVGTAGFSGDGGDPTAAKLDGPLGVALDPTSGHVAISDTNNLRIRLVTGL